MFKKYIFSGNNILTILIISIFLFCLILSFNIITNLYKYAISNDYEENRTLIVTFTNYNQASAFLDDIDIVTEYYLVSSIDDTDYIETYEVVIDKYDNKKLFSYYTNQQINYKAKYNEITFPDRLANILYKVTKVYICFITFFLILLNIVFISKILANENKSIAILKAVGYNNNQIIKLIVYYLLINFLIAYFIANIYYLIFYLSSNNKISDITKINNALNYNLFNIPFSILLIFIITIISILSYKKKINNTSPSILYYDD